MIRILIVAAEFAFLSWIASLLAMKYVYDSGWMGWTVGIVCFGALWQLLSNPGKAGTSFAALLCVPWVVVAIVIGYAFTDDWSLAGRIAIIAIAGLVGFGIAWGVHDFARFARPVPSSEPSSGGGLLGAIGRGARSAVESAEDRASAANGPGTFSVRVHMRGQPFPFDDQITARDHFEAKKIAQARYPGAQIYHPTRV